MIARRKKQRRRRSRPRSVEATIERELQKLVATLRKGLGGDDSFEKAVASLRRQVIARGGDGTLHDVQCHLAEDGKSALLAADWGSDEPAVATFVLPVATTEDAFDARHYIEQAEG